MQGKLAIRIDDGVPCVAATLKADDNIRFRRLYVSDLTLSFVAPVGSYNRCYHLSTFSLSFYVSRRAAMIDRFSVTR